VLTFQVNFGLYKRFSGYRPFLYNITVDACNFLKNPKRNPIASYFYDFIKDISNMNHTCPFDVWYIYDISYDFILIGFRYQHDLVWDKLSTEHINHRVTNILSFPEGDYMMEMHWIAYDIVRAVVNIYVTLS